MKFSLIIAILFFAGCKSNSPNKEDTVKKNSKFLKNKSRNKTKIAKKKKTQSGVLAVLALPSLIRKFSDKNHKVNNTRTNNTISQKIKKDYDKIKDKGNTEDSKTKLSEIKEKIKDKTKEKAEEEEEILEGNNKKQNEEITDEEDYTNSKNNQSKSNKKQNGDTKDTISNNKLEEREILEDNVLDYES